MSVPKIDKNSTIFFFDLKNRTPIFLNFRLLDNFKG